MEEELDNDEDLEDSDEGLNEDYLKFWKFNQKIYIINWFILI